jgi:hypothetical protein
VHCVLVYVCNPIWRNGSLFRVSRVDPRTFELMCQGFQVKDDGEYYYMFISSQDFDSWKTRSGGQIRALFSYLSVSVCRTAP